MNKWPWVAYGMMWIATAAAVIAGIYYTKSIHCLWFLLIPAGKRIMYENKEENEDDN